MNPPPTPDLYPSMRGIITSKRRSIEKMLDDAIANPPGTQRKNQKQYDRWCERLQAGEDVNYQHAYDPARNYKLENAKLTIETLRDFYADNFPGKADPIVETLDPQKLIAESKARLESDTAHKKASKLEHTTAHLTSLTAPARVR